MNEHDQQPADRSRRSEEADLRATEKLVEALRHSHNQRVFVPPRVDDAILGEARRRLAAVAPPKRKWQPAVLWGALAASLALMAGVWFTRQQTGPEIVAGHKPASDDLNGDERVDVLDALLLARRIEEGDSAGLRDLNGDGVVDHRDAEWIARQSVRLEKGDVL